MEMERELARGRGEIICNGVVSKDVKKGDGVKYGVTEQTLLERFAARRDVSLRVRLCEEGMMLMVVAQVQSRDVCRDLRCCTQ